MEKPDFENFASEFASSVIGIHCLYIYPDDPLILGYTSGCEKIWTEYVEPCITSSEAQMIYNGLEHLGSESDELKAKIKKLYPDVR